MVRTACIILSLAFLALGLLGITGFMPMFKSDLIYVNIGEMILGGLGLLIGIYSHGSKASNRQDRENAKQRKEFSEQRKEIFNQRQENYEQKKKENEQLKKENIEQLKETNELQRKENERLRKDNEKQRN